MQDSEELGGNRCSRLGKGKASGNPTPHLRLHQSWGKPTKVTNAFNTKYITPQTFLFVDLTIVQKNKLDETEDCISNKAATLHHHPTLSFTLWNIKGSIWLVALSHESKGTPHPRSHISNPFLSWYSLPRGPYNLPTDIDFFPLHFVEHLDLASILTTHPLPSPRINSHKLCRYQSISHLLHDTSLCTWFITPWLPLLAGKKSWCVKKKGGRLHTNTFHYLKYHTFISMNTLNVPIYLLLMRNCKLFQQRLSTHLYHE